MPTVLQNETTGRSIISSSKYAALISLGLVLPFVILESINNTLTRQNAPGLIVLFGLLWLLPMAFFALLLPMLPSLRTARSETSEPAGPFSLLFRISFLILIAVTWGLLVVDQLPCFLGTPNCD